MTLYILPGLGATSDMYQGEWRSLPDARFLNWPSYGEERSLPEMAARIVADHDIQRDDIIGGSSFGGMVALEIASQVGARQAILIGSATSAVEVQPLLRRLAPLAKVTPIVIAQVCAGTSSGEVGVMLSKADPKFIRAMCLAISKWPGPPGMPPVVTRIHGVKDRVIPCPETLEGVPDAGHLIALTHPETCVREIVSATQ